MHNIVAVVVVYGVTRSALWVGMVSIAQFAPQVLLTPIGGTWADRGHMGRQIILGRLLCVLGTGSAAVFCAVRGDLDGTSDATVILVATLVAGLGFVIGGPAQQAIVPLIVRPGELPTAMALNSLPLTFALAAGPVGGAFIAAQYSPTLAFSLATLSHVVFICLMLVAALPAGTKHKADTDFRVRTALAYARADRTMLLLLVAVAAIGFGSDPSITLAPSIAEEVGGSTATVGQLSGAFGLGALVGFFGYRMLTSMVRQPRVLQVGLAVMAVGTALQVVAPTSAAAVGAFGIAGLGFMVANTASATLIQQRVPPVLRGRIMALWMVAFLGFRPAASVVNGYLADAVAVDVPLLVTVGVLFGVLIAFRPKRLDFSPLARYG